MSELFELRQLRVRLDAVAGLGYPLATIEKDYAISYVLAGVAVTPGMESVVLKGGTLLRKIYFGKYRFSEDLDFSALEPIRCESLLRLLTSACDSATAAAAAYSNLRFSVIPKNDRSPHPMGQCEYRVAAQFPWHRSEAAATKIKVEVAMHEHLVFSSDRRPVLHGYAGEPSSLMCARMTSTRWLRRWCVHFCRRASTRKKKGGSTPGPATYMTSGGLTLSRLTSRLTGRG